MDCRGRAVKAAAGYKVSGPGSIPAAPTSRDSLMTALGAGNKYPETQGLGLGKPRFFLQILISNILLPKQHQIYIIRIRLSPDGPNRVARDPRHTSS